MATENVRQRTKDEPTPDTTSKPDVPDTTKGRGQKRRATMARRGLKTLILAVAFPATLHLTMFLAAHRAPTRPNLPYPWILHAISLGSGSLMGLCAWLVWAKGGFHRNPTGLGLFLGYLVLSLAWDRVMIGSSGAWAGLVVSLGMFGALSGCCSVFKRVNPIAGDLAKLCLIWAGFVVILNIKLLVW